MRIPVNIDQPVTLDASTRHEAPPLTSESLLTPVRLASELKLKTVLAVAAHPDDLEFGAAATIAGLSAAGVNVVYGVLTSGDAGGFDPDAREQMAEVRQAEQRGAAEQVGVEQVEFLDAKDGYVEANHDLIRQLVALIRRVRPDMVITSHPERDYTRLQRSHPDHLACGEAVVRAAYPAVENPFAYPELAADGLDAFKLRWLGLMGGPDRYTNLTVDVTGTAQRKITALNEHVSQHPDPAQMRRFVLKQMESLHPEDGRFAEPFHLVQVNDDDTIAGF